MSRFSRALIVWYKQYKRELPWRKTRDPYIIWISEIILQQTRVNQGINYFNRFIERFPTVHDLANASEDEVLKQWEGLGYYSRARNLHFTAKYISYELKGHFPDNYNDIIKLKGIGPYTAAAISSICFNEYQTVVDGNVFRFISRMFGIETPINSSQGKKEIEIIAHDLNDDSDKGSFNQALMEFGAIQCTPKSPMCKECIFVTECIAFARGLTGVLPVKEKKIVVKDRFLNFLFVRNHNNQTVIEKRIGNDIWKGLYQFPMFESSLQISEQEFLENYKFRNDIIIISQKFFRHKLTHQNLNIQILEIKVEKGDFATFKNFKVIDVNNLEEYALPKPLERFVKELSL